MEDDDGTLSEPPAGDEEGDEKSSFGSDERDDDDVRSNASVEINSEHISAETLKVASTIIENIEKLTITADPSAALAVTLSVKHFRARTSEELDRCEEDLVFEAEEVKAFSQSVEEKRVLILCGEPESGKGSTALLIASHLRERFRLKGALVCQGLDSAVRVDFETIASSASFRHQAVVFEDALAGENPELARFLKTLDPILLTTVAERLRKNHSVIILTAASHTLEPYETRLNGLGILVRVATPPPEVLLRALQRFAGLLPLTTDLREKVTTFLQEEGEDLAGRLATVPKISRFAREYLADVADKKLTVQQALGRMDDLSQWLLTDLASDLEGQAAVLAIVLGSATSPTIGVPWFPFDQMWRKLVELLRKERHIPEDTPLSLPGRAPALLERARAEVLVMPAPLPDLVRFRNDRYPVVLWQTLLGNGRGLATVVLPLLHDLVLDSDPYLRTSACRALGRLGQIGPVDLSLPILVEWTHEESTPDDLLGAFLQGVVASEDAGYRDFCLGRLRHLACQEEVVVATAAIRGLRLLGRPDPCVPLRELREIARLRLPLQVKLLRQVEGEVVKMEENIRKLANPRRASRELRELHAVSQVMMGAALMPSERLPILGSFQYSLAGVLFSLGGDPGPVLEELIVWMKPEAGTLAPLLAYMFLHRKGLIDLLDRHPWIAGSVGPEPCSRFLLSASRGPEETRILQEFLEKIFRALPIFPGLFRFLLEQRLLQILRAWSQEGCKVIRLRPTVLRLFSGLLASKDAYLQKLVERFLRTDQHFAVRGSRLRAFAVDALSGRTSDAAPMAAARPRRLPSWLGKIKDESD